MDARFAAKAERAREQAFVLERGIRAHIEVDDVEGRSDSRCGRVEHGLRADVEKLEPIGPRLEAQFRAEVGRSDLERNDARPRRGLEGEPYALGGLDDGDNGRSIAAQSVDGARGRLGEHDPVRFERAHGREVVGEERRLGRIDPDEPQRAPGPCRLAENGLDERSRCIFCGCGDRVLEVRDNRVRSRPQRLDELALVTAGCKQKRAGG